MALSLRKAPKFHRKEYHRLGQKRPSDSTNEFVLPDFESEYKVQTSNDDCFELSETSARQRLHNRKTGNNEGKTSKNTRSSTQEFLTYEIQPQDTLQGIALKFGCSVSELKRVNNLFQDQDAFALPTIRIPAREHSILFEVFSQQGASCSNNNNSTTSKTFHVSINQMMQTKSDKEPSQFLKEMDKDIQRMVEVAQQQQNLEIGKQTLNSSPIVRPLVQPYFDGANWGINWYWLLIVLLVISVLAPVTFGIYYATMANNHEDLNNTTTHIVNSHR